jgi:hypothetical protein
MPTAVAEWVERVLDAERRGDLLVAFDLAERAHEEHPDDVWLTHRSVLALARAGSTDEARRRFAALGLEATDSDDVQALGARIAKDQALAAAPGSRRVLAERAAGMYRRIFERTGDYYPCVNAATMMLVAGRTAQSTALAGAALAAVQADPTNSYYRAASEAEARLLLGQVEPARRALQVAAGLHAGDYAALASTRRQLRLICGEAAIGEDVLDEIAGPLVVHYCGHRITGPGGAFPAESEPSVAAQIAALIDREPPGFAYGALANGADILLAEAMLAAGAEVHVVLPYRREEFVRHSVADAGAQWTGRFERCLSRAASVTYATEGSYLGDDVLYRYGAELAMGLALLRARYLDSPVRQIALWDGRAARGDAGTALDVATWRQTGRPVEVLELAGGSENVDANPGPAGRSLGREVKALLFADIQGFSRLSDEQLAVFAQHVLRALATTLDRYAASVRHRNTWGDALYVVLDDASTAAACALDLQRAIRNLDLEALGLPAHLALRLGAHIGPVFSVNEPVLGLEVFMGTHVSMTARIEPVTPPGCVYATESFAAALALRDSRFRFDYVGRMPGAKGYGRLRMYRLRPTDPPGTG